ncbi:MAG: hypothetical protein ACOCYP_07075 [Planctomycetota bacterium]
MYRTLLIASLFLTTSVTPAEDRTTFYLDWIGPRAAGTTAQVRRRFIAPLAKQPLHVRASIAHLLAKRLADASGCPAEATWSAERVDGNTVSGRAAWALNQMLGGRLATPAPDADEATRVARAKRSLDALNLLADGIAEVQRHNGLDAKHYHERYTAGLVWDDPKHFAETEERFEAAMAAWYPLGKHQSELLVILQDSPYIAHFTRPEDQEFLRPDQVGKNLPKPDPIRLLGKPHEFVLTLYSGDRLTVIYRFVLDASGKVMAFGKANNV